MDPEKQNPNPIIHNTAKRSHSSRLLAAPLLGSSSIRRYHLGSLSPVSDYSSRSTDVAAAPAAIDRDTLIPDEHISSRWMPITAEDRSVALALSAAAYPIASSAGTSSTAESGSAPGLDLLQQAGFALFRPQRMQRQCRAISYPSYSPTSTHRSAALEGELERRRDEITVREIFDIVRNIQDPEHPLSLEQLNVVREELIEVVDLGKRNTVKDNGEVPPDRWGSGGPSKKNFSTVHVEFTPTIPHCSMATLIGLSLRVKLLRSIPARFKVVVKIESGTHNSELAVNKQLADKERVRAALENEHLLGVVNRCIAGGMEDPKT